MTFTGVFFFNFCHHSGLNTLYLFLGLSLKENYIWINLFIAKRNCSHDNLRNGKIQTLKLCIDKEKCDLGKVEVKVEGGKL